jgi:hypothetical protein
MKNQHSNALLMVCLADLLADLGAKVESREAVSAPLPDLAGRTTGLCPSPARLRFDRGGRMKEIIAWFAMAASAATAVAPSALAQYGTFLTANTISYHLDRSREFIPRAVDHGRREARTTRTGTHARRPVGIGPFGGLSGRSAGGRH